MDSSSSRLLLLLFLSAAVFIAPSFSVHVCRPARCNNSYSPTIRFPFRLVGSHDPSCGYPGFDVSCNSQGMPVINLPSSGEFLVNWIDYTSQSIYINDPGTCLPDRISSFSADGSAFRAGPSSRFRFFNCSMDWKEFSDMQTHAVEWSHAVPVVCFPIRQNMPLILALPVRYPIREISASNCTLMPNISIPLKLTYTQYWSESVVEEDLELTWSTPDCQNCELAGLYCGFKNKKSLEIGCTNPPKKAGLSRGAKYGIVVGVGIPGIVFLIGIICFAAGKCYRHSNHHHHHLTSSSTATLHPPHSVTVSGLDRPTIESYPKTVIGESRRLPSKVSDGTCPICLSEYQPKETLRSIPECNHYFHALCIDEWLKLNGSCPLCRNSLESRSVTSCSSSTSSAFSISFSSPSSR